MVQPYPYQAKKSLGQNFLVDTNIAEKIVRAAGIKNSDYVVEIGPGLGSLTKFVLKSAPKTTVLVEKDSRFIAPLQQLLAPYNQVHLHNADALSIDLGTLVPLENPSSTERPSFNIIGNLPYNIAAPLIVQFIKQTPLVEKMTFMVQKEMAERIVAPHGSRTYGRLSVMSQWFFDVKKLFDVPKHVFVPQPQVTSSIVQFIRKVEKQESLSACALEKTTHLLFQQRRKMLRNTLKTVLTPDDLIELCKNLRILPTDRPETLSVQTITRIAQYLENNKRL